MKERSWKKHPIRVVAIDGLRLWEWTQINFVYQQPMVLVEFLAKFKTLQKLVCSCANNGDSRHNGWVRPHLLMKNRNFRSGLTRVCRWCTPNLVISPWPLGMLGYPRPMYSLMIVNKPTTGNHWLLLPLINQFICQYQLFRSHRCNRRMTHAFCTVANLHWSFAPQIRAPRLWRATSCRFKRSKKRSERMSEWSSHRGSTCNGHRFMAHGMLMLMIFSSKVSSVM